MLEIHMTSFIQRHILQKSGQFLLQKSEVRLSCWRPGWPIVGTAISDPSPRQTIVQEISNFT